MGIELNHDVVVIHHKNCLDGIAAAWSAWKYFEGKVDLVPAQYGDNFEEMFGEGFSDLIGKRVFCLDFAFDLVTTKQLMGVCQLVVLDHHDTAWKNLNGIASSSIDKWHGAVSIFDNEDLRHNSLVLVDQTKSGAILSWLFFFGKDAVNPPSGLSFVQDRDLWQFKHPETRPWTAAAFSHELTVENFDMLMQTPVHEVVLEGKAIQRHMDKTVNLLAKSGRTFRLDEYAVPVVNCNALFASDLGHKLGEGEMFSITYNDSHNARQFSLRSRHPDVKVNEIAERFGGGGHPGAAGFRISFDDDQFHHSHTHLESVKYIKNGDEGWTPIPRYKEQK